MLHQLHGVGPRFWWDCLPGALCSMTKNHLVSGHLFLPLSLGNWREHSPPRLIDILRVAKSWYFHITILFLLAEIFLPRETSLYQLFGYSEVRFLYERQDICFILFLSIFKITSCMSSISQKMITDSFDFTCWESSIIHGILYNNRCFLTVIISDAKTVLFFPRRSLLCCILSVFIIQKGARPQAQRTFANCSGTWTSPREQL